MTVKVPKGALRFVDPTQKASVFADSDGQDKMLMTVYSGGVIKDHWWWGDLALDLKGVKFTKPSYPVLENHYTDRKIGFTKRPIVGDSLELDPKTTQFVDTPYAEEFRKLSKQGFPYQASLYGMPSKIQRLAEKEEVEVNGYKFKGPGTVWREWEFKEASVCVFGWDSKTNASAFSREETEEIDLTTEGGEQFNQETGIHFELAAEHVENLEGGDKTMDLKQLKKDHPELFAQIIEEGRKEGEAAAEKKFSQEREGIQAQLDETNKKLSSNEERMARMEKELTLSRERELQIEADKLFSEIFADSDIEPRLEPKVRTQINHNKYVKDDKLDVEAFTKAVEEEIADWESRMPKTGVQGFSNADDDDDQSEGKFAEENKSTVVDLLSRAGQKS